MRTLALVALFMLAACAGGSAPSSPSSAGVSPTPGAAASPSPLARDLTCRLPVAWAVQNGQAIDTKAGFVTFPGGTLAEDPSAPAHSVFYDRAFSKWLPAWRTSVSADGRRYAYTEGNSYQGTGGKLHVVDVTTGVDTVIYSGGTVYSVVDFAAEGIYLTGSVPEGYPRGLWLQDPAGGPARLISSTVVAPAVGGGAAWGIDFNAADPSPGPGGMEGPRNRVLRLDLRSGATTPWFYLPGANIYPLGFDSSGSLFVTADFVSLPADPNGLNMRQLWLVASATAATKLFTGQSGTTSPSRLAAIDSHGVWFDSSYGAAGAAWLYKRGSIEMVATVTVGYFTIAGGCIP